MKTTIRIAAGAIAGAGVITALIAGPASADFATQHYKRCASGQTVRITYHYSGTPIGVGAINVSSGTEHDYTTFTYSSGRDWTWNTKLQRVDMETGRGNITIKSYACA